MTLFDHDADFDPSLAFRPERAFDVVLVAYRSAALIGDRTDEARALPGVAAVVVVDHGDDGSDAVAAAHGARSISNPANPGFGAGQNAGVAAGHAPFVLLLNPDARPDPQGVEDAVAYLAGHFDVGAAQGEIRNEHTGEAERSQGVSLGPVHLLGRALGARRLLALRPVRALAAHIPSLRDHVDRVPTEPVDVESLAATAVIVRRAAFESIDGFDESYFLYGEDLDLCRRLRDADWRVVALPGLMATHENGASSTTSWSRELEWWRGTMLFAARWWSTPEWAQARVAAVLRALALAAMHPTKAVTVWRALVTQPRARRAATRQ